MEIRIVLNKTTRDYGDDLYSIRMAEGFDRAVEKRVKGQTGNREELIKTARIELEAEWENMIGKWEPY